MTLPRTLRDLAGAPNRPHPLDRSAIVLIDAQNEYVDGAVPLPGIGAALQAGAALLDLARTAGRPVVHIRHRGRAGGLFDPGTRAFEIAEQVAPAEGEAVIDKPLPNAFAKTELESRLRSLGAESLIVAGFMTHMCVSSTVRCALALGFGCTVVADACATRDLPDGQGGVVGAGELHRAELAALADRFAVVVGSVQSLR